MQTQVKGKLSDKKVKINRQKILSTITNNDFYSADYLEFIELNKNTIFTAELYGSYHDIYTFREDSRWIFFEDNLIVIT